MHRNPSGKVIYSPSDLMVFMESEYESMMDRHYFENPDACEPDTQTETNALLSRRGDEHEKQVLADFIEQGLDVVKIDIKGLSKDEAFEKSKEALRGDSDIIFQPVLRGKGFGGHADFLRKDAGEENWQIWDSKLALSVKPKFLIQLCCYAEMLQEMTGKLPEHIGIILGDAKRVPFLTRKSFSYYQQVKSAFLSHMESFDPQEIPTPTGFGSNGRWETVADEWLVESDHLSLVANIRQSQVKRLAETEITAAEQLAQTDLERVKGIGTDVFLRLRDQARLQKATANDHVPQFELVDPNVAGRPNGLQLLPPASDLDVYFDMEGYPLVEGGLEYLFGASTKENGSIKFDEWWTYEKSQEKVAFEGFVDWAYERWQRDPSMHIYHYAHYEVTALKRLMGDYASRENKIDTLLRAGAFVDLYQVVRQGLCIGTPSYSIKDVERLYRPPRTGDVGTAEDSIIFFDEWRESGEPHDWLRSPILGSIRDYNKDDCESTLELAEWLRARQAEAGIDWITPEEREDLEHDAGPRSDSERLSVELLENLPSDPATFTDEHKITQMLGWVLEFHRREAKPQWWSYFSRATQSLEELYEDNECLAGLERTNTDPMAIKRSLEYQYTFDGDQESKIVPEKRYQFAHDVNTGVGVTYVDYEKGLIGIKLSATKDAPPRKLDLVPGVPVKTDLLVASIFRTATIWKDSVSIRPALNDFLGRNEPNIAGRKYGAAVIHDGEILVDGTVRAVADLQESVLCIQGPPGCGKTFVAAHSILDLIGKGKRVGVTSNSHKAIINLLNMVSEVAADKGIAFQGVKIGTGEGLKSDTDYTIVGSASGWIPGETGDQLLAGATAWAFSREDWADKFDYLFVDEAGQVSQANLVAMAPSSKNLIIIGDQMQLEQPLQGTHPGHSGQSIMEFFLHGHQTVPPEKGILLDTTWRLHPDVCTFISDSVYDGRLTSAPHCRDRVVQVPENGLAHIHDESGIIYIPSEHIGNSQSSEEEAVLIAQIVVELIGRTFTPGEGESPRPVVLEDILFVAPYNMQVNLLKSKLEAGARVASVDKFQGQEAPIVILSMCASSTEDIPRGMDFLLSKNRLNVAISRAQSIAIVVGSPTLKRPVCTTIEQIELANFFCRMVEYASGS